MNLDLKTRKQVLDYLDSGFSERDAAATFGVGKGTISRIKTSKKEILDQYNSIKNHHRKNLRPHIREEAIDCAVLQWMSNVRAQKRPVDGPTLRMVAEKFGVEFNCLEFKSSSEWLDKFKARHHISFKVLSGEKNSADYESAEAFKLEFKNLIVGYEPKNIFNLDETALYTKLLLSKNLLFDEEFAENFKPRLDRVTIALICSAVGEKLKPIIIGKSANPRCLKNIDRKKLGVDYYSSAKGWMTTGIFQKILNQLNSEMTCFGKKIILLIDNATSHGLLNLSNVKLVYFPKNSKLLQYIYFDSDNNTSYENLKEIKILETLIWIKFAWQDVTKQTIVNCFNKTGLWGLNEIQYQYLETSDDDTIEISEIICDICNLKIDESKKIAERFIIFESDSFIKDNSDDFFGKIVNDVNWDEKNVEDIEEEIFFSEDEIKLQMTTLKAISSSWESDYHLLKILSNAEQKLNEKLKSVIKRDRPRNHGRQMTLDEYLEKDEIRE